MTMSAEAAVAPRPAPMARVISAAVSLASGACVLTASQAGPSAVGLAIGYAALGAAVPEIALLIVAAGFGIATTVFAAFAHWPARMADILPIAALCGIHARSAISSRGRRPPLAVRSAALAMIAVLAASVAVQLSITTVMLSPAGVVAGLRDLAHTFLEGSRTFSYLIAAVQFATCVGLLAATAAYFTTPEKTDRLLRMLIAGGAAVAVLNVARLSEVLLRTGAPLANLAPVLAHVRISVTESDPNAMGSLFAMLATLAFVQWRRERGLSRYGCAAAAVLIGAALWMTGSRTALVAVFVAAFMAAVWKWRSGWRTWITIAALGAAVAAAIAAFPNPLVDRTSVVGATAIRAEMARVALRLWKTDPSLGVGVGQFLDRSGEFISDPFVRAVYGRENAHNNFLQVLAELGIVGAAAGALLLLAALRSSPPSGLRPALLVFLATCLAGHPLLVADVAFVFATAAGAAAAYARASLDLPLKRMAAAVTVAAAIAVPISYRAERDRASFEHLGYGVSEWRTSPDGHRYRRSDGDATVFVPGGASEITVEVKAEGELPLTVQLWLDGRSADQIRIPSGQWFRYPIVMPAGNRKASVALRLKATDRHGAPAAFDLAKITSRNDRD